MSAAGFPAVYGHDPNRKAKPMPPLEELMGDLTANIKEWAFDDMPLVAEPGRVVVARAFSLIVRVLLAARAAGSTSMTASGRRCQTAGPARSRCRRGSFPDPARRIRKGRAETVVPFKVCGATCDSVDILSRPFWLPETVDTGDWIEIGHIGAYSLSLRTRFNGFYPDDFVEVTTPFRRRGRAGRLCQPGDHGGLTRSIVLRRDDPPHGGICIYCAGWAWLLRERTGVRSYQANAAGQGAMPSCPN
jgi:ornithine decarboxylase